MNPHKLISLALSICLPLSPAFATPIKPITCNHFQGLSPIKHSINKLDKTFAWDNPGCKIVGTPSIFPKQDKQNHPFEPGLQLFVYQDTQLKFICLPGWVCKAW